MIRRTAAALVLLVLVTAPLGAKKDPAETHRLVDRWTAPGTAPAKLKRLLIVGITDDTTVRKQFENKFVSHLRGKGIDGVTSYSIVPDLTAIGDAAPIVREIRAREIDGAISVRVVPLGKPAVDEDEWGAVWRRSVEIDGDLRELIDASLPVSDVRSKHWGVEVALWETTGWDRVWAARTNRYTRKELRRGAGSFVQDVIQGLGVAELL